jgi:hypothetical protein
MISGGVYSRSAVVGSQSNWGAFAMSELDVTETGLETALLQAEMVRVRMLSPNKLSSARLRLPNAAPSSESEASAP